MRAQEMGGREGSPVQEKHFQHRTLLLCCCTSPVDTGSVVVQQHTAWTQEENLVELFDVSSASSDVVWRPDGLVGQKCVTPSCRRPVMWCDTHNDSKPADTRQRVDDL